MRVGEQVAYIFTVCFVICWILNGFLSLDKKFNKEKYEHQAKIEAAESAVDKGEILLIGN